MKVISMLMSNGLTSIISMFLTFTISRQGGIEPLSQFALAYAALALAQIVIRESCLNMALASRTGGADAPVCFDRAVLLAIFATLVLLLGSIIAGSTIVAAMAWATLAFCCLDFLRLWVAATTAPGLSMATDLLNFAIAFLAIMLSEVHVAGPTAVICVWAFGMTMSVTVLLVKLRWRPFVSGLPPFPQAALLFGVQGLVGSGSVQLSNLVIGGTASPQIVGIMRGATTFSGPLNLLTATIQSATIRSLSVSTRDPRRRRLALTRWSAITLLIQTPLVIAVYLGAQAWGDALLGDVWGDVEPLVPWVLLDALLVAATASVHAAHRADFKANNVLALSLVAGAVRIAVVPWIALQFDARGAVIALMFISAMTSLLLWVSYFSYRVNRPDAAK